MPLNPDALLAWSTPDIPQTVTTRDSMLYALSLGLPFDDGLEELRYVYEKDAVVFPTMPVILGRPDGWQDLAGAGVTRAMIVHWAQRLEVVAPLVPNQQVVSSNRIAEVLDRGPDKGGVIILERHLRDAATGALLATSESTVLCRADGGFGGARAAKRPYEAAPEAEADRSIVLPTDRRSAMLYRLNGDYNPLHIEPAFAARAGFERPILHGLCTYGVVAAGLRRLFDLPVEARLERFEARFSRPLLPGAAIRVEAWGAPGDLRFRAHDDASGTVVLDFGRAVYDA